MEQEELDLMITILEVQVDLLPQNFQLPQEKLFLLSLEVEVNMVLKTVAMVAGQMEVTEPQETLPEEEAVVSLVFSLEVH